MEIFTTGYPRSGNTWLNRLLGDLFSSPLQATPDETKIWYGKNKGILFNKHIIRKTHRMVHEWGGVGYLDSYLGQAKMIFIQRDPRDVAVSAMFYRQVEPNLMGVLKSMVDKRDKAPNPIFHKVGWYEAWVRGWVDAGKADYYTKYELLVLNPVNELRNISKLFGEDFSDEWIESVVERQSFDRFIKDNKDNQTIWKHSMRIGTVGDWRNYFKREDGEYITKHLGQLMVEQEYIEDLEWYKELR